MDKKEPLSWFPGEGTCCRVGRLGLGLAGVNNFSRLWGIGADLSCLVPGLGVIRAGE